MLTEHTLHNLMGLLDVVFPNAQIQKDRKEQLFTDIKGKKGVKDAMAQSVENALEGKKKK